MNATETRTLVETAYAQWPHIEVTPTIIDTWHTHLQHTDARIAFTGLREILGNARYAPTIAAVLESIRNVAYRANMNRGELPVAKTRPVPLDEIGCSASAGCLWMANLKNRHTSATWLGLSPTDRINTFRSHIRHHADTGKGPLGKNLTQTLKNRRTPADRQP